MDAKQLELAQTLYDGGQTDVETIRRTLGITRHALPTGEAAVRPWDREVIHRAENDAVDKSVVHWLELEDPGGPW
jgi:hypothetical protein